MEPLLCQAIRQRRVLALRYRGYTRAVEPHVYGFGRDGEPLLRGWQRAGDSDSGASSGWKLMRVEDIASADLTDERFDRRPDYRRADPAIVQVFCQV